ncbi:MAG: restriction endonuclease subunit S [Gemmatimonadetes bacterium]|nr:restriction endonuclease subunit S [Gemmatimonadota bacterium]MYB56936.1 restriction endonuclease subunit S [Gemmatimonadota bacterium]
MTTQLKSYPEYKPSGIKWLDNVPAHWDVRRLKRVASLNPSKTESRLFLTADTPVTFLPMERVGTDGKIDEEVVPASSVWNGFTYFRRSDVLVAKITPCFENGKGACLESLSTEVGFGSTEFHVLRAGASILAQFLYRLTTLAEFRHSGADEMIGAAGQQRVPQAFVANYPLALPPLAEQTAIVRYLDHTDRRIRRYVSSREQLIELLEEYRQAVIHHAVTHGLDSDVRLKPSGVEWLGDVPAHWGVAAVKRHYSIQLGKMLQNGPNVPTDIAVPYLKAQHVQWFSVRTTDAPTMWASPHEIEQFGIRAGDLLVCEGGEGGRCSLVEEVPPGYIIQNALHRVRSFGTNRNDYLQYVMSSISKTGWFDAINNKATIAHFTAEKFGSLMIPIPPLPEQTAIVAYLDKATAAIDAAIDRARREIELLGEYRTRLIADVVTGKVDVREAVADLPQ